MLQGKRSLEPESTYSIFRPSSSTCGGTCGSNAGCKPDCGSKAGAPDMSMSSSMIRWGDRAIVQTVYKGWCCAGVAREYSGSVTLFAGSLWSKQGSVQAEDEGLRQEGECICERTIVGRTGAMSLCCPLTPRPRRAPDRRLSDLADSVTRSPFSHLAHCLHSSATQAAVCRALVASTEP